ncbi:MAG: diacylglycerol kinase [Archangium sp.]|nr:diacylglycerol kinase [Archangium sp.]
MDIALVVNLNARRGSHRFAAFAKKMLPNSRVIATRSVEEVDRFVEDLGSPRVILSGGGDGTACGILDALRQRNRSFPTLGLVKLGTGNAWAIGTHAPSPKSAMKQLADVLERGHTELPTSDFSLVEVEGRLTPFAGAGWDAELLHDYKMQKQSLPRPLQRFATGGPAYAVSIFSRTILRNVLQKERARVRLINLGEDALTFDPHGNVTKVPAGGFGECLYEGPYGVAGAGTTAELGFGFKALHFARVMPGRMHVRVLALSAAQATRHLPNLWRGVHPIPHSHDFLLTHCRMEFDREVPVEIGGDAIGLRNSLEYRIAPQIVPVIDWKKLRHLQ